MIVFHGCVKCQGDLYVERNIGDADLVCLQCGYRRALAVPSTYSVKRKELQAAS
jgi:hypothetical protein